MNKPEYILRGRSSATEWRMSTATEIPGKEMTDKTRDRLTKLQALAEGATTAGEKEAVKARIREIEKAHSSVFELDDLVCGTYYLDGTVIYDDEVITHKYPLAGDQS